MSRRFGDGKRSVGRRLKKSAERGPNDRLRLSLQARDFVRPRALGNVSVTRPNGGGLHEPKLRKCHLLFSSLSAFWMLHVVTFQLSIKSGLSDSEHPRRHQFIASFT